MAKIDWGREYPQIILMCAKRALDPALMAAIRNQEHGRAGREFGILSRPAPDYQSQLRIASRTVLTQLATFQGNPFHLFERTDGVHRLMFKPSVIQWIGDQYAPMCAHPLNPNWAPNVLDFYDQYVDAPPR